MFVRIKRIKGKKYAYLVENEWTSKGPRQKVTKYLGSVIEPVEAEKDFSLGENPEETFAKKTFKELIEFAVELELGRRGFKKSDEVFINEKIVVKFPEYLVMKGAKNVVLKMNKGFFCRETTHALLNYDSSNDHSGRVLAQLLISSGLPENEELFVELFAKSRKDDAGKEQTIYY